MAYLALVRHGQSQWNAKNLWTGWTDISLTELGRDEARQSAKKLIGISWNKVFISDLVRAKETYLEIARELNLKLPIQANEEIKERDYGDLTGRDKDEVLKEVGQQQFDLWHRSWDVAPPGGESLKDVSERVVPYFLSTILPELKKGKNVLICAHGNSLRALMKYLEGISDADVSKLELATGQVVIYELNPKGDVVKKDVK